MRISEERDVFRKGYRQQWSSEVFRVVKQSPRDPVVYKIEDLRGEPVIGSFYELELQKVSAPEARELEAALKRGRERRERPLQYYVEQRGYLVE